MFSLSFPCCHRLQKYKITIGKAQTQIGCAIEALEHRRDEATELYTLASDKFRLVPLADVKVWLQYDHLCLSRLIVNKCKSKTK